MSIDFTGQFVPGAAAPLYVTSLPANPYDGQEVYYGADPTNGVIWHLRYRSAASGSYKWEYIGGPPMTAEVLTLESTTSTTFTTLSTAGPTITTPLAGDYVVTIGATANNNSSNAGALMSYAIGGTSASTDDAIETYNNSAASDTGCYFRTRRKTGLAASTALAARYAANVGGNASFWRRSMSITPIRVG